MGTYRVHKYSTLKDIEEETKKLAWPLGVVVFGPECEYMDEAVAKIQDRLKDKACYDCRRKFLLTDGTTLKKDFENHNVVALVLNVSDSASCRGRGRAAKRLRRAGAKSIIMVYVRANGALSGSKLDFNEVYKLHKQIDAIEKSQPHRYEGFCIELEEGRDDCERREDSPERFDR